MRRRRRPARGSLHDPRDAGCDVTGGSFGDGAALDPPTSPAGGPPLGVTPSPAPLGTSPEGRVVLARTCVHRGDPDERQELTVTAGAGETVGYSTYYSDYSSELNRPDYTSGYGAGQAGSDGRFRATWVVPAGATPGRATVQVIATDMEDPQSASFTVVANDAPCP